MKTHILQKFLVSWCIFHKVSIKSVLDSLVEILKGVFFLLIFEHKKKNKRGIKKENSLVHQRKKQIVLKAKSKTDDLNKRKWKSIKFHAWAMFQTCSRSFKASKFTSIKSRELYPKYFSAIVVDIDYRLSNIVLYDQLLDGSNGILVESDIKSVFGIYFWYRCNVTSIL